MQRPELLHHASPDPSPYTDARPEFMAPPGIARPQPGGESRRNCAAFRRIARRWMPPAPPRLNADTRDRHRPTYVRCCSHPAHTSARAPSRHPEPCHHALDQHGRVGADASCPADQACRGAIGIAAMRTGHMSGNGDMPARATPSWSGSRRHDHRNSSNRQLLVFLE